MKKIILIPIILLVAGLGTYLIMASPWQPEGSGPVGYELLQDGGVVHIWNYYDDYYFEANTGIQLTNHYQDYWTHNYFCGGIKLDEWEYYCTDALLFNWQIDSDDETYVNITGWRDVSKRINGKWYTIRYALRYHLKTYDQNLTIEVAEQNVGTRNIPVDTGFAWHIRDIAIDGDYGDDYIEVGDWRRLLRDLPIAQNDNLSVTEVWLTDLVSGEYLYIDWDENLNYIADIREANNKPVLTLFINAGTLNTGQFKKTSFHWIDAPETDPLLPEGEPWIQVWYAPYNSCLNMSRPINATENIVYNINCTGGVHYEDLQALINQ